jgi:hypothetical protein
MRRVEIIGVQVYALGFRVQGSGFRVQGSGFRGQGSEVRRSLDASTLIRHAHARAAEAGESADFRSKP